MFVLLESTHSLAQSLDSLPRLERIARGFVNDASAVTGEVSRRASAIVVLDLLPAYLVLAIEGFSAYASFDDRLSGEFRGGPNVSLRQRNRFEAEK